MKRVTNTAIRGTTITIIILIWTTLVFLSYYLNFHSLNKNIKDLALNQGRSYFNVMKITRLWNANHGGVYVPVSKHTQPNPYLDSLNRDFYIKELGIQLTKVNPAYMTRQIAEIAEDSSQIKYHLTSLKPIRPENKADAWEAQQLLRFENGANESFEYFQKDNVYKYMASLAVTEDCIQCHEKQGYKIGDIRGGISVSMDATEFQSSFFTEKTNLFYIHFIIFIIGSVSIILFRLYSQKKLTTIESANQTINAKNLELIKSTNDLKKTTEELKKSNFTKDRMFSIIAHDLKEPFNSILGFSDFLMNEMNEGNLEQSKKHSLNINRESTKVFNLLLNLLDWARTQTGKINLAIETCAINEIIESSIDIYQAQADTKDINLMKQTSNGLKVECDKQMIFTVIRNLVSNAIKFTPKNGKITISAFQTKDNYLEVFIKDNGSGMDQEKLDSIFNFDEQFLKSKTHKESGTGLGLIICKEFITLHNGEIYALSNLKKGSTFIFKIPIKHKS